MGAADFVVDKFMTGIKGHIHVLHAPAQFSIDLRLFKIVMWNTTWKMAVIMVLMDDHQIMRSIDNGPMVLASLESTVREHRKE